MMLQRLQLIIMHFSLGLWQQTITIASFFSQSIDNESSFSSPIPSLSEFLKFGQPLIFSQVQLL